MHLIRNFFNRKPPDEPVPSGLQSLPVEILIIITQELSAPGLSALCQTHRYLFNILDPILWSFKYGPRTTVKYSKEIIFPEYTIPIEQPSLLNHAAKSNNMPMMKKLLALGCGGYLEEGKSPLESAIEEGHAGMVTFLLNSGAKADSRNLRHRGHARKGPRFPHAVPTLQVAISSGQCDMIPLFLTKDSSREEFRDAIEFVVFVPEALKVILSYAPEIDHYKLAGGTFLYNTLNTGQEITRIFLDAGVNVNIKNEWGKTALHKVAAGKSAEGETPVTSHDLEMVELLVSHGADINAKTIHHIRPIDYAIEHGRTTLVQLLLDNGASLEHRAHHPALRSLLNEAPPPSSKYLAQFLIDKLQQYGFVLSRFLRSESITPDDMAKAIMDPRLFHTDISLFLTACALGGIPAVEALLDCGIDVNVRDERGRQGIHLAALNPPADTARALLDRGADINSVDNDGSTCLHIAAHSGYLYVAEKLISYGANPKALDKYGKTPEQVARDCGFHGKFPS